MQNGKTIKTRKNVDFNVDIFKLQKEIKKLLTSLDEYAILNKLSREELLHNSKKEIKKLLTNMKHFDII